ncbi:MAG: succinylglutamate desuccinylase/aspartoacylase family protein [Rhodospirillaceae bacterium]|nr:succinylglutamate desuccinylase/aspartoacylase family protein [Rhodospirillaceae bacterium]
MTRLPPLPYPIELTAPDISCYRAGNTGIDFVHRLDSGRPGAAVLVTALVHGNELCGAIALDWLMRQQPRPIAGSLTLAFCNVLAFEHFDPDTPGESRYMDEDFNRVWSAEALDGPRRSHELDRARALRPVVDAADLMLDIHSMQHKNPPLIISGPHHKGRRLAGEVGFPALVVSDEGHASGRRMRDYGPFGDPAHAKNALLVECGQHWEMASAAVAKETLLRFLVHTGTIEPAWAAAFLPAVPPPAQRVIEVTHAVTIRTPNFRFADSYKGLEVIARKGSVLGHDGDTPVTTPYDDCVLIMPSRRLVQGQTAVRLGRYLD